MKPAILTLFCLILCVAPASPQTITLVTVGDSLTAGDGDDGVGGGYPTRLLSALQSEHPQSTLQNLGISGHTSDDLVNVQLDQAVNLLSSAPAGNRRIGLVWIGSNDLFGLYNYVCDEEYGNNYSGCEGDTFGYYRDNVNNILGSLAATGAEIYIALLDDQSRRPVMADQELRSSSFDRISEEDVARMSVQVGLYNEEIASQASTLGATTVDFFNTTIFEDWQTLDSDGNHPNGAGYDAIAEIWYQTITGSPPPTASHRSTVPVVVHSPGAEGTNWRSSVVLVNATGATANVDLTLATGSRTWTESTTVAPGASVEWRDIVVDLFGASPSDSTAGALGIASDQKLWITSRAFNQDVLGTFGQYLPALTADDALSGSDRGYLPNLKGIGFRSNLGLVNLGSGSCQVRLTLYDAGGSTIGNPTSITVPAGEWVQKNDVFGFAGAAPQALAYATLEIASGVGSFWAYASVVDDATGDATTIPVLWD